MLVTRTAKLTASPTTTQLYLWGTFQSMQLDFARYHCVRLGWAGPPWAVLRVYRAIQRLGKWLSPTPGLWDFARELQQAFVEMFKELYAAFHCLLKCLPSKILVLKQLFKSVSNLTCCTAELTAAVLGWPWEAGVSECFGRHLSQCSALWFYSQYLDCLFMMRL